MFILKRWPILNWQPQSPFCKDRRQSLWERSLDMLGDCPHLISPRSSFLKDPAPCSHRHTEDPPVVSSCLPCCPEFFPAFPTLCREAGSNVWQLHCNQIFWKYPERLLGHQTLLISSILWNPPDNPAWVSFNNYLIFYFARGLICIQSNAMCPGTLANKTICPAQWDSQKHKFESQIDLAGQPRATSPPLILPLCETETRPNWWSEDKMLSPVLCMEQIASTL